MRDSVCVFKGNDDNKHDIIDIRIFYKSNFFKTANNFNFFTQTRIVRHHHTRTSHSIHRILLTQYTRTYYAIITTYFIIA